MIINDCIIDLENSMDLEPAATPWYDLSRYKNEGAITAGTWVQRPGGLWVLGYDGATTEVVMPTNPSLNITTGDFSLLIWAYLDVIGTHRVFFGGSSNNAPHLFSRNNEAILLSKPSVANAPAANTPMVAGSWQLIICTFDNSAVANNLFYYRNGEPDGIVTFNQDFSDYMNSIGVGNNAASWHWDGMLGMPKACNYILTPGQVRNYFEKTKHLFGVHD